MKEIEKQDCFGLLDYGLDEMRFSGQVNVMDPVVRASSGKSWISTCIDGAIELYAPDDVVGVPPKWPNRIYHDPGLDDSGFDRQVIPDIHNENPYFMTEFELSLDHL